MIARDIINEDLTFNQIIEKIYYWDYIIRYDDELYCYIKIRKLLSLLSERIGNFSDFMELINKLNLDNSVNTYLNEYLKC